MDNRQLTTFRIPVFAQQITSARWPNEFLAAYKRAKNNDQQFIVLGQGANVLFVDNFAGAIVVNQYKGIAVTVEDLDFVITVNSGVTIDELITYCHRFKIYGLENLTSIPSSVGTAVIGNIGAYGLEFEKFVDKVVILDLETNSKITLTHKELNFSYRDSVLKHQYAKGYVVLTVILRVPKNYKPILTYAPLNQLDPSKVSPQQIRELVNKTRQEKLPDFNVNGNAGSFFINPSVDLNKFNRLQEIYPNLPHYPASLGMVKLSAGWLIENAGLKGFALGKAQVSPQHALVLTNKGGANGEDIAKLAAYVQKNVYSKFDILLTPEIRFVDSNGEIDAVNYLKKFW